MKRAIPAYLVELLGLGRLRPEGRTAAWPRLRRWFPPHQGARERARRQAQVARLAARGRDWTGRRIADA